MDRLTVLQQKVSRRVLGDDVSHAGGVCRFPPEWIVPCINNFCNLHSRMCDGGLGQRSSVVWTNMIGDDPGNMGRALLRTVRDGAAAFTPRPKLGLAFTEPLIHTQILDFAREIAGRGFYCSITTNGFLLPQRADALVETSVDQITVSVDGPPAVHDAIRGREVSFARLSAGVERVHAARARHGGSRPEVQISATITDLNFTTLRATLDAVAPLHPASVNFAHRGEPAVGRSSVGTMDPAAIDTTVPAAEIAAVRASAAELRLPATFHLELTTVDELIRYYREPSACVGGRHGTDPYMMMIGKTDGTVIPAHSRRYNVHLGRVQDTPLPEMWNNARHVAFRRLRHGAGGSLPACTRRWGVVARPAVETHGRASLLP